MGGRDGSTTLYRGTGGEERALGGEEGGGSSITLMVRVIEGERVGEGVAVSGAGEVRRRWGGSAGGWRGRAERARRTRRRRDWRRKRKGPAGGACV
jgi:hypothetical protein